MKRIFRFPTAADPIGSLAATQPSNASTTAKSAPGPRANRSTQSADQRRFCFATGTYSANRIFEHHHNDPDGVHLPA